MATYYYSAVPSLAWILAHYFYGRKHRVWVAEEFFPYRLPNPKSSNPLLIYQDLYQPWRDRDDFDKVISSSRLNARKGVLARERSGLLTAAAARDLKDICDRVDIVFLYPIVYRVDLDAIPSWRRLQAGSARVGSHEFLIEDLDESEFSVLFLDFHADVDFKTLVYDEIVARTASAAATATATLLARC